MNNLLKLSSVFNNKTTSNVIDLTDIDNFSYSSIMRKLNERCSDKQIKEFLKQYKICFDFAVKNNLQKPDHVALQNCLIELSKKYKIKISKDIIKSAAISELGSPEDIGNYIANVIHFLMKRISSEKRSSSLYNLKNKLSVLSPYDLSKKEMPNSAAIGQSITFVKNILFNHDPNFIKEVLRNVVSRL